MLAISLLKLRTVWPLPRPFSPRVCVCVCVWVAQPWQTAAPWTVCVCRSAMADSAMPWTVYVCVARPWQTLQHRGLCVCVCVAWPWQTLQRCGLCVCVCVCVRESRSAMADSATPRTVAHPCTVPQLCRPFSSSSLRHSFPPLKPFYLLFSPSLNSPILFSRKTPM